MSTISELAARHGVTHRTLRFYEQKGLLSPKREGRKRIYSEADERKFAAIVQATELGFVLSEIPALIVADGDGYRLSVSDDKARSQLLLMEERLVETHRAVERLRVMTRPKAA